MQAITHAGTRDMELFYENSQPFLKFLQSQGLDDLLRKTRLRLRDKHAIVPHVRTVLPIFPLQISMLTSKRHTAHPSSLGRTTNRPA